MTRRALAFILAVAVAVAVATPAMAQTSRSGGGENARLMQQMAQVVAENTQLQAENAGLRKELGTLKEQGKQAAGEKQALQRRGESSAAALSRSAASIDTLNQTLARQRSSMEDLVGKFRETATALRNLETERAQLTQRLAGRERELQTCAARNLALYEINAEVLERLENQGFWSAVARQEPFTRLKRVELENLVEDYRNRAEDQRAGPQDGPPPG